MRKALKRELEIRKKIDDMQIVKHRMEYAARIMQSACELMDKQCQELMNLIDEEGRTEK